MKNLMLLLVMSILGTCLFAQAKTEGKENKEKVNVPAVVKSAFAKDFPAATKVRWEKENGDFEVGFKLNEIKESATYDNSGHRKEIEVSISTSALPAAAQSYIKTKYVAYKLKGAAKITDDKNVVVFEAELSKDGKSWDVIFSTTGEFIKEVQD